MTITTKFKCGDRVYTLDHDTMKVTSFVIGSISVSVTDNKATASLYPKTDGYSLTSYDESKCFPTEQELHDYIFGN